MGFRADVETRHPAWRDNLCRPMTDLPRSRDNRIAGISP